jgi:hypothetical protein
MWTAGGREVSDAERCGKRAMEVGRRRPRIPNRAQHGRSQGHLRVSDRCDVTHASSERSARVVLHEDDVPLNGFPAGVVIDHAGWAVVRVMAFAHGSRVRGAPRVTEQRGARPNSKQEHNGQKGCSKHDHARRRL